MDARVVPQQFRKTHDVLIDYRNKYFAHVDPKDFQADDSTFGNINQIRVRFTKEDYEFSMISLDVNGLIDFSAVKRLCTLLGDKVKYHTGKFCRKYERKNNLPSGGYIVSVDPKEPRAFVPVPPFESRSR